MASSRSLSKVLTRPGTKAAWFSRLAVARQSTPLKKATDLSSSSSLAPRRLVRSCERSEQMNWPAAGERRRGGITLTVLISFLTNFLSERLDHGDR
eukprot:CAMPEP_0172613314 /NCGR_PEP_ID=MMETSP1068-20121228/41283_1 /TAXON_ID=35684 /ORGANISM="Pseudopedinella elastica, Strain CCMP716" /LENGTH=95 /DNA_ID=CAMNT_0013417733 /DNA_START=324 /DNA_END=608 /DNA_ORIENTATION=-